MEKKIKIWFHSETTSDIKEFTIKRASVLIVLIIAIVAAAGISYTGYDYIQLKKRAFNNECLSGELEKQTHEIKSQRNQIQTFALEIEQLKKKIDRMMDHWNDYKRITTN